MTNIKKHYQQLFHRHGRSAQSVQWSSTETQHVRFDILNEPVNPTDSVIDLGCGLGELLHYFRSRKGYTGQYLGLDLVPEFINDATQRFSDDDRAHFSVHDVIADELPKGYQAVLVSGMFNNEMENNLEFIQETLHKAFDAAEKVVAFNALSTYVDYFTDGLYYTDPAALFHYCKSHITDLVTLRHDYRVKRNTIPFEFTMYLHK